jgi:hypothetical protein
MEKITRLINEVAELCERENVPMLCVFGKSEIDVVEYAPDNTPDIYAKARAVLFNSTKQKRRSMRITG